MPKYLMEWKYTEQGMKAVRQEGGTARQEAGRKAVESVGGTLESYYFAFGGWDGYLIADLPDNESAAAMSMAVAATGALTTKIVVLLTAEEVDAAVGRSVEYRAPAA